MQRIRTNSHTELAPPQFQIETLYYISHNEMIPNIKVFAMETILAGKFIFLIKKMRFIMKCIAYFGKMHNNAKDAELYKQKSLPEHFPNTFIQY